MIKQGVTAFLDRLLHVSVESPLEATCMRVTRTPGCHNSAATFFEFLDELMEVARSCVMNRFHVVQAKEMARELSYLCKLAGCSDKLRQVHEKSTHSSEFQAMFAIL